MQLKCSHESVEKGEGNVSKNSCQGIKAPRPLLFGILFGVPYLPTFINVKL